MRVPSGLTPIVDGDVLRYEIGFGAETGWRAITNDPEAIPPYSYVEKLLTERLASICDTLDTDKEPVLYLSEGKNFRFDIALKKGYKANRKENKPWHFKNLTVTMTYLLNAHVITGIEADDAMAIDHSNSNGTTVLCSRDKDLKQCPGYFYSWELHKQPSFGPTLITKEGSLSLSADRKKLIGTGDAWFYAQVLMGDTVDNTPGLPNCGPVRAYEILQGKSSEEMLSAVKLAYQDYYKDKWEAELLEQGILHWIIREKDLNGEPLIWKL